MRRSRASSSGLARNELSQQRDAFADAQHEPGLRNLIRRSIRAALRQARRGRLKLHVAPNVQPFRPDPVPHFHHRPELFLQLTGSGAFRLSSGLLEFGPGDLILIPRGIAHDEFISTPRQPYLNLVFSYSALGAGCHAAVQSPAAKPRVVCNTHAPTSLSPRLIAYLDDVALCTGEDPVRDAALQHGLLQAHLAVLERIFDPAHAEAAQMSPLIARARHLAARWLTDRRLNVAWLAERLGCSADYLSHRFQQEMGRALIAHINEARVELGCRLLETTTMNVSEVAFACGYGDAGYFGRVFRRSMGCSPRQWRRQQAPEI